MSEGERESEEESRPPRVRLSFGVVVGATKEKKSGGSEFEVFFSSVAGH